MGGGVGAGQKSTIELREVSGLYIHLKPGGKGYPGRVIGAPDLETRDRRMHQLITHNPARYL